MERTPTNNQRREESLSPHTVSDRSTDKDTLGFTPYVEAISRFLLNQDTSPPLTLSIEGDWGSGKSSFMKQLRVALTRGGKESTTGKNNQSAPLTVWFNAWRHDK